MGTFPLGVATRLARVICVKGSKGGLRFSKRSCDEPGAACPLLLERKFRSSTWTEQSSQCLSFLLETRLAPATGGSIEEGPSRRHGHSRKGSWANGLHYRGPCEKEVHWAAPGVSRGICSARCPGRDCARCLDRVDTELDREWSRWKPSCVAGGLSVPSCWSALDLGTDFLLERRKVYLQVSQLK